MTTKLNLTLQEETARKIKIYAKKKNTSVSKIVERQLSDLLNRDKPKKGKSFVEKYAGILKDVRIDDIDKLRDEYLKEKYGI